MPSSIDLLLKRFDHPLESLVVPPGQFQGHQILRGHVLNLVQRVESLFHAVAHILGQMKPFKQFLQLLWCDRCGF